MIWMKHVDRWLLHGDILFAWHAEQDENVGVTERGMAQSKALGYRMAGLLSEYGVCACIVTSSLIRTGS